LDIEEWISFLSKMSHTIPPVLGQKLFLTLDTNRDGMVVVYYVCHQFLRPDWKSLSISCLFCCSFSSSICAGKVALRELVPTIFNLATSLQVDVIIKIIESENEKMLSRDVMRKEDIAEIFDYLDEDKKGYVTYDQTHKALDMLQVMTHYVIAGGDDNYYRW